jgi:hypothetical protein
VMSVWILDRKPTTYIIHTQPFKLDPDSCILER